MQETWAISGIDLHLDLTGTRVRAALEAALREALRTGRLRAGTRLPSSRALAADLGIARNTVADAYGQLVAEGWLTAHAGSGTRVAQRSAPAPMSPSPTASVGARTRYDLRPGTPDLAAFPRAGWLAAARRALSAAPFEALGYADTRGLPQLRGALAEYLARARGVSVSAEGIVICSGFTQGLSLLCQALRTRGARSLAIEEAVLPSTRETARAAGLTLISLPVDGGGAAVDQLGEANAVLLTAAHQFPLGVPLAARRRARVVEWARETGALIIEDDYDGEFRYDRHPLGALQALSPDHVTYAGTASKTLAPGLRLGWLVPPPELLDAIVSLKILADRQTDAMSQLTLAQFIASGAYDRHVRRSRLAYRRRRDRLLAALRQAVPDVRVTGIAAGLHALVQLPDDDDEDDVITRALEHGLSLEGLGAYLEAPSRHAPALVVGYGTPPEHALTAAIARLCAVLAAGA
jgi:GntR family transcriptional regulator / MocR family aminotransferase